MPGKTVFTIFACLCALTSAALAEEDRPRNERRRWQPPPHWQQHNPELMARSGFVFLDGVLLEKPYTVARGRDGITINGHALASEREGQLSPHDVAGALQTHSVVVAFEDHPVVMFNDARLVECLRILSESDVSQRKLDVLLNQLPENADRAQWSAWLGSYVLPEPQRVEALAFISASDKARAEGEKSIAANQRLSTWAYPLTVFGMLMSVVSFGHLLQFPPRGNPDLVPSRRRAELCRATVIFLVMVVILSGLDLLWTLLTSQAGQMHELNPIGQQLMDDPWLLSLFKGVATLASCGLLMMLRRHPRAQLASWWLCLVCTLLTFRWLVLNSMFVA